MIVTQQKAVELLKKGEIVAIPTETVYGLAADAFNINAVKKIFKKKGRPSDNPLIVHISDLDQLYNVAEDIPAYLYKLIDRFWPGPLSLILNKRIDVPDIVTGGLETVAVRMPDHPLTLDLIKKTGPLTAPSANKSGRPSPTKPSHVMDDFGDQLPILDGGPSKLGLESTVLDLSNVSITILRPGFIHKRMIEETLGENVNILSELDQKAGMKSPGTRFTHYKPKAAVRWLDKPLSEINNPTVYIILHSKTYRHGELKNVYEYNGDYEALARDLYDQFRTADHLSCSTIVIEPFSDTENHSLIPALQDRITRAISS